MRYLAIVVAFFSVGGTACATGSDGASIGHDVRYRLVSVDGQAAGDRTFTISFDRSGAYSASFDCSEHFGRYTLASTLVLEPGGTAPGACDEVDLKTGRPVVRRQSFGAQFLNDQPFAPSGRGAELALTSRRHRYVLSR
jgi:hypothetical protein